MSRAYFVERDCCPVCRSKKRETLYSCGFLESPVNDYLDAFYDPQGGVEFEYLDGGRYVLMECSECDLIYQWQILNPLLMGKLYEEWIDPQRAFDLYSQKQNVDYYSKYALEILLTIAYLGKMPARLKFLDFGMGWGYWCRTAQGLGCNALGMDISAARIAHSQSQGIKAITWDELHDHQFDFINTEQVFEHISQPLETLNILKEALAPGGLIKISVPNGNDIKRSLEILDWTAPKGTKNSLNAVSPLEHINCFQHQTIIRLAANAGLGLVRFPAKLQNVASLMGSALSIMSEGPEAGAIWRLAVVARTLRTIVSSSHKSAIQQQGSRLFFCQAA